MEIEKKSNGALVGTIVILLILVLGGIYIWQTKVKQLEMLKTQSSSITSEEANSVDALEQEIGNTDTNLNVNPSEVN